MTRDEMDEIKRHFDVVAESLANQIGVVAAGHQLLADGQDKLVQRMGGLEQRMGGLDQHMGDLEQRIDRLVGEIKAMLRLSFVELERRVLGLETAVEKLLARMDRLESGSSH